MKSETISVGDKVKCTNVFGPTYTVIEKFKTVCTLEHRTGEKEMLGGKWVDEVYIYAGIRYSQIKEIVQ